MSKIQDVPFITKVIDTLSDELKSGLYDLIDGQVKTPIFRSLVNNDYAITEANDKGKVQFVTLETLRGNYTGYLAYNSVYCVLIAFKGNTQALDMLNINVAKHTFAFVNESLSILELRVELEDGKEGVTPTDLGVTNNNIHLAKGTKQIGEGVNLKTLDGNTLIGSGNVGFKTINDQEIVGDGNIVVGEGGTIAIDETPSTTSENALMNKTITNTFATKEVVENKANVDGNYPTMTVGNADNANNLIATKGLEVESYFTFEKTGGEQASAIESGNGTLKNLYGKTEKSENLADIALTDVASNEHISLNNETYFHLQNVRGDITLCFNLTLTTENVGGGGNWQGWITLRDSDKNIILSRNFAYISFTSLNETKVVLVNFSITSEVDLSTSDLDFGSYYAGRPCRFKISNLMMVKGTYTTDTMPPFVPYYDGLKHTHITGVKSTGINQWDEEWEVGAFDTSNGTKITANDKIRSKNLIPCAPNETYFIEYGESYQTPRLFFYDKQGNFLTTFLSTGSFTTPQFAYFMTFHSSFHLGGITYNHDICINFSNPNINGNYYPYEEETLDIEFEGNGVGTASDEINVEEKKKYQRFSIVDLGTCDWHVGENNGWCQTWTLQSTIKPCNNNLVANIIANGYTADTANNVFKGIVDKSICVNDSGSVQLFNSDFAGKTDSEVKQAMQGVLLVYELAEPIVTDIEIPKDTIKVWNGGSMEALGTEIPVGTKIFYQKNIKAFTEAFGEAIDWNPERIKRLAKLSITPEYVNISLNPSQANAYAVAQVYNATFTIVISTALTGTADSSITFQDSEIDLSSFETQPAESIYDMDGKKVSEEPTTEDCNIASFVGRSYNGIVLWSLLHSGVNKVKVHFEQAIPLDSEGNGKLDCRASLIL